MAIQGDWYKGADLQLRLETEVDLSGAIAVTMIAEYPGGPTKEYAGAVDDFTGISATLPAGDNIYKGEITLRVTITKAATGKKYGDPETIFILDTPTVTP